MKKSNPIVTNVPILYPLKTPENLRFSGVFRGHKIGTLIRSGLIWNSSCIYLQILDIFEKLLNNFSRIKNTSIIDHMKGSVKYIFDQNKFLKRFMYKEQRRTVVLLIWEHLVEVWMIGFTAQKMKFSVTDFSSKCDQILSFLRIWLHLLKKS